MKGFGFQYCGLKGFGASGFGFRFMRKFHLGSWGVLGFQGFISWNLKTFT